MLDERENVDSKLYQLCYWPYIYIYYSGVSQCSLQCLRDVHVIEFQKRGLSYSHITLTL